MARLFDEMRRGFCIHPWRKNNNDINERILTWVSFYLHQQPAPVFVVDDIAKNLFTSKSTLSNEYTQPIAPPYPVIFIEYRGPHNGDRYGAFVAIEETAPEVFMVRLDAVIPYEKTIAVDLFSVIIPINRQGIPDQKGFLLSAPMGAGLPSRDKWNLYTRAVFEPIISTLELLNCRNIQIPKKIPDAPLNKKWLRKNTYPLIEYHTLKLQLPATRNDSTASTDPGATGNHKRLHMARGHFAHYGPEGKLFGRLEGTFWIPAHLKGNKEKGILLKDYGISSSKRD